MTAERKVIRAKIGLLERGKQLGHVSQACKIMGCSRDSFCRFQEPCGKGGEVALAEMTKRRASAEEPRRPGDRAGHRRACHRAAGTRPGADCQRTAQARQDRVPGRRPLRLAAP